MELSPALLEEMMARTGGDGELMFGESDDPSRSIEAMLGTNASKLGDAGAAQSGQALGPQMLPDDGLTPRQRAGVKWGLMKGAISKWFSDNWPLILAGGVLAIGGLVAGTILTGGGLLAALPAILQVLGGLLMAIEGVMLAGYIKDYLTQGWAGATKPAGKSLAKAGAWTAIEIISLLTFKAGGAAIKGGKAAAKGARRAVKGAGRMARKGAGYAVKQGKVVMKGISSGIGKMYKSLNEMGQGLLKRTRFKGFRMKVKGPRWALQGKVNPWVTVAQGSTRGAGKAGKGTKKTAAATGDVADLRKADDITGAAKTGKTTETVENTKVNAKKTEVDSSHNPHADENDVHDVLGRNSDAFEASPADQERLFESVKTTNARMQGVADDVADAAEVPRTKMGIKGNDPKVSPDEWDQDAFTGKVLEKTRRNGPKGGKQVGTMTDMTRGRFDCDSFREAQRIKNKLKARLEADFGRKNVRVKSPDPDSPYKRYHILATDPATGITHEFQVGTKALTDFIENQKVLLPKTASGLHGNDFHVVMYDTLDKLKLGRKKLKKQFNLDLPDDIAKRVGLDDVRKRYDDLMKEAGSTTKAKPQPVDFQKRMDDLADDLADVSKRLEDEYPGTMRALDTKGGQWTSSDWDPKTPKTAKTTGTENAPFTAGERFPTPEMPAAGHSIPSAGDVPTPAAAALTPKTSAQKFLDPGQEIALPPRGTKERLLGAKGRVVKVDGDIVHVDRGPLGQTTYSRPEVLQKNKIVSKQIDPQPTMADNHVKPGSSYNYKIQEGPAFKGEMPDPGGIQQGALGDCWFVAQMGSVSRKQPERIRSLIQNNGDGTFDITLYLRNQANDIVPSTKTVDMMLPSAGVGPIYARPGKDVKEYWAALLEKRLAMETGSYESIRGSKISEGLDNYQGGMELLTGRRASVLRTAARPKDELLTTMKEVLDDGRPISAQSHSYPDGHELSAAADKKGVFWNHEYTVLDVDVNAATVTLHNPHGVGKAYEIKDLLVDDFVDYYQSVQMGGK
jgi:hypothetical protein